MAVSTYKAQLNYYDPTYGWGNEGTTCQGNWSGAGGNRTGVMYFPGLSALKGKIINSVKLKVTTGTTGNNASKTAKFYASANQGGIKTSLGANHKTGSSIGSVTGTMYNNSSTFTITFLSSRIAAGEDTFCIYDTGTTNYFKWSAVTLEVDWSEPSTQPTFNKTSVAMGSAVTISTPATNSAYRHTLRYEFGGATETIASNVASSYSWTPPVSLAAQIPSAVSGSCTIYCDTYNGSELLGTRSAALTLTVPESVVPTAGTLSASVTEDTSGTGQFVKGMCRARLRLSGSAGAQGSTIKSTKITGGGWTENDADMTTGVLTKAGTITFKATVTDSRGRTATAETSITVQEYSKPKLLACTIYRCDSAGNRKNDGTYAAVQVAAEYSAISGNTLTINVAYKLATASSYGSSTTLSNNTKKIIGGSLAASSTYDVRITVTDKYNSVSQVYKLKTKSVLLSFLRNVGVAIGKVAEIENLLDIALPTRFRGKVTFDDLENRYAQAIEHSTYKGCFYRYNADGTAEWINPPLVVGTEYRTVDRIDGKTVYQKAISVGTLPSSGQKNTAHGISTAAKTVGFEVFVNNGTITQQFPLMSTSGTVSGKAHITSTDIVIYVFADLSAYSGTAVLRYTKD